MKNDLLYIDHILNSIDKIFLYTDNLSFLNFSENPMVQDAVVRNLEIVGEATKRISTNLKSSYVDVPWREMAGIRDKLIHDYMGVDLQIIWKTIEVDLPELKNFLNEIQSDFRNTNQME